MFCFFLAHERRVKAAKASMESFLVFELERCREVMFFNQCATKDIEYFGVSIADHKVMVNTNKQHHTL